MPNSSTARNGNKMKTWWRSVIANMSTLLFLSCSVDVYMYDGRNRNDSRKLYSKLYSAGIGSNPVAMFNQPDESVE